MKDETEMTNREHIVAVVEPNRHGESPLDIARQVVARGGRATIVVLGDQQAQRDIQAFADAEGLSRGRAEATYWDQLAAQYASRVGANGTTVVANELSAARQVIAVAESGGATVIAIPQRFMQRRTWRSAVGRAPMPIMIAPQRAA